MALLHHLRSHQSDLIWVHSRLQVILCRVFLVLRLWRPACPVVFTYHGLPFVPGKHPVMNVVSKALERILLALCPTHHLVFLTRRMANSMSHDVPPKHLAQHQTHVLENCSDLGPLPRQQNAKGKMLIMTGRTGRQKDFGFAVRLLAHLPEKYRLTLCGPGTEHPRFHRKIAKHVAPDVFARITFAGPLTDIRPMLACADGYLLTSRYEGTPIGALEAFEAGLPIILRDFVGAQDLTTVHPCSLLISGLDMNADASRITTLFAEFDRDPERTQADIKEIWQRTWSPQIFAANARRLVASILNQPDVWGKAPNSLHDAPAPRPDPYKNKAARIPAPQPYRTGDVPSAENG